MVRELIALLLVLIALGWFMASVYAAVSRDMLDAQARELVRTERTHRPRIVHFEGCALWDEVRHACEDD
jgi:hypothetical protein